MIFGQLIELNMRNIFFGKIIHEIRWRYYSQTLFYLGINILKSHAACVYGMLSWGLSEQIETKLQITCFYLL